MLGFQGFRVDGVLEIRYISSGLGGLRFLALPDIRFGALEGLCVFCLAGSRVAEGLGSYDDSSQQVPGNEGEDPANQDSTCFTLSNRGSRFPDVKASQLAFHRVLWGLTALLIYSQVSQQLSRLGRWGI